MNIIPRASCAFRPVRSADVTSSPPRDRHGASRFRRPRLECDTTLYRAQTSNAVRLASSVRGPVYFEDDFFFFLFFFLPRIERMFSQRRQFAVSAVRTIETPVIVEGLSRLFRGVTERDTNTYISRYCCTDAKRENPLAETTRTHTTATHSLKARL